MESRGGINGSSIAKRIGLLAVAAAPLLWAAPNRWTSIGPFGGNARTLAIDPQDPATIYAGTSGGVFKTTNSGASWTPANSGLPIGYGARALVIDPVNSATLYVGGACGAWGHCGIFKSIDGARSWQ